MARPPGLNAAQMRQIQSDKVAVDGLRLDDVAKPIGEGLMSKLEQLLQQAVENLRPVKEVTAITSLEGLDAEDLILVQNRVKGVVTTRFATQRQYTVVFIDGDLSTRRLTTTVSW